MENKSEIPEKILEIISIHLGSSENQITDWKKRLTDLKSGFLNSEAIIFCEDCNIVFYIGKAEPIVKLQEFCDWKMLSFRHAWDTRHKVKIYFPYLIATTGLLMKKNPLMYATWISARHGLKFDGNNFVEYSPYVEDLRQQLIDSRAPEAFRSNDENWDHGSKCYCSVCMKSYYDPKRACLCHAESKPWLPLDAVNSIHVKGGS